MTFDFNWTMQTVLPVPKGKLIFVLVYINLYQFDCKTGVFCLFEINLESVPGINQYWAIRVISLVQGNNESPWWDCQRFTYCFLLTPHRLVQFIITFQQTTLHTQTSVLCQIRFNHNSRWANRVGRYQIGWSVLMVIYIYIYIYKTSFKKMW